MSDTDEDNDENENQTTNGHLTSVNIYSLWRSSEREKFKLQAVFDPDIKFDFECVTRLFDGKAQDRYPSVYRLKLNLIQTNNDEIAIKHKKTLHPVEEYQLCLSESAYLVYKSHTKEDTTRMIRDITSPHHFLFNVVFPVSAPGKLNSRNQTI